MFLVGAMSALGSATAYIFSALRGGDHARYEISGGVLIAAFVVPPAIWITSRGRSYVSGALGSAATALVLAGLLTLFSGIGLLVLGSGLVVAVLGARYISWRRDLISVIGGVVTSAALAVVASTVLEPPLVDCAGPHARVALPSGARATTTVSADGGRESGEIIGDRTYRYVCERGRLIDFSID